jgi:hypothetical protein
VYLWQQRLTALPAVCGANRVRSATRGALAGGSVLLEPEDALNLPELGIDVLERGRPPYENVDSDTVANRHLVYEPAEIPLQLGDARAELISPALEVDNGRTVTLGGAEGGRGAVAFVSTLANSAKAARRTLQERGHHSPSAEEVAGELPVLAARLPTRALAADPHGRRRQMCLSSDHVRRSVVDLRHDLLCEVRGL